MQTKDELLRLIRSARAETENLSNKGSHLNLNKDPLLTTREMLDWLEREITQDPTRINPDLLRRFRNQGVIAFKEYENTRLENLINRILELLPHLNSN
jgi:hypothetical protein